MCRKKEFTKIERLINNKEELEEVENLVYETLSTMLKQFQYKKEEVTQIIKLPYDNSKVPSKEEFLETKKLINNKEELAEIENLVYETLSTMLKQFQYKKEEVTQIIKPPYEQILIEI